MDNLFYKMKDTFKGGKQWVQGDFEDGYGHMCLAGALGKIMFNDPGLLNTEPELNEDPLVIMFAGLIQEHYPERIKEISLCTCFYCTTDEDETVPILNYNENRTPVDFIIAFNDHEDTTWEDVERLLEKAAAKQNEML